MSIGVGKGSARIIERAQKPGRRKDKEKIRKEPKKEEEKIEHIQTEATRLRIWFMVPVMGNGGESGKGISGKS